jgi:pentatricopeptide repeat protein
MAVNLAACMPNPAASPEEAVQKMNQTLKMMSGQPEIVCQLFGAFTAGGVMPDMQTYELVIRACSQQSLFECAEMLLSAAEAQGLPYQSLLWGCLEGTSDNAFVVKWAPKALEANLKIPARCFVILLRDRAAVGGSKLAVALFKLLLRVGLPEDKAAQALVQSIAEIHQLQSLPDVMRQMQSSNERVNALIAKLAEKMSVNPTPPQATSSVADEASAYIDITDSEPCSPPPGLPAPVEVSPPQPVSVEDAGEFLEALQQSQDKQDVAAALKTLADMKAAGVNIAYSLYYGVFKVCLANGNANDAQTVLEEMRQSYNVDMAVYTQLVRAHGSKGRFDKAERVLEDMRLHDVNPDEATYNALLDTAARTGRFEKGWHLLGAMMKQEMTADKYSVSLLLKNVSDKMDKVKMKRGIELVEKYIDMQRDDADDILFNSLLDCCCRVKDIPRLEKTLQKMKSFNVKPSPATFGTLLKAYGAKNDAASVVRVWSDMKAADVGMNTVTYGCMLDACVKCGNYDQAEEVFAEMKDAGMHRNTILYTTMIKLYSKQKKLRRAMKICEEMHEEGVPLNCVTYNSLIDAAIRCRDLPVATKMLEEMKESSIAPDLITYSTLIKGFCDQGDIHVACSLLQRLKSQNMKCDEILYNSLLEGTVKSNDLQRGVDLFQEMVADRVQMSNITFSIMVKLYAQAGRLDQAMALVQRMEPEFNVKPTNVVFACLVKCCIAAQRVGQAAHLLLGLPKATKVQPDQQMFASVLPGLVAQNQLDLALDIFENLCKAPAAWDNRSFNIFQLAQRLFEAVGHTPLLQEKARKVLAAVRPTRSLVGDQERTLSTMLGSAEWTVPEFVPGHAFLPQVTPVKEFTPGMMWQSAEWEAYQDRTGADRYNWMQWSQQAEEWGTAHQITPPRSNVRMLEKDENASPNVMQILLQSDAASGEKMPARQKAKKETPEPSPHKGVSKPTGPLEFSVPAQPIGVLVEKNN